MEHSTVPAIHLEEGAAGRSLEIRGWGLGEGLSVRLCRTPGPPPRSPVSPVALEALHLPQVRPAPLLRLPQGFAGGAGVLGEGEAVGDGLNLLRHTGHLVPQICGAKAVLEGRPVPECHPTSPNWGLRHGGCPRSLRPSHSPWMSCAILSTASSGMELKVPLPCEERWGAERLVWVPDPPRLHPNPQNLANHLRKVTSGQTSQRLQNLLHRRHLGVEETTCESWGCR